MSQALEPMHAAKYSDVIKRKEGLHFPVFAQPKIDGIRGVIVGGAAVSRTWKPLPNAFIQSWVKENQFFMSKFDGEFIVGSPTADDVYRGTMSGVMSAGGTPDFRYLVFDTVHLDADQQMRFSYLIKLFEERTGLLSDRMVLVKTRVIQDTEALLVFESDMLALGYEGIMTRAIDGMYKHGRATPVGQELVKMKRFIDDEAVIEGFEELYHNNNVATANAYGRTARSSHLANKVAGNTLGALKVCNGAGQKFNVGTGFDQALRQKIWDNRDDYLGKQITYRFVKVGGYDVPRFPTFHGFREPGT